MKACKKNWISIKAVLSVIFALFQVQTRSTGFNGIHALSLRDNSLMARSRDFRLHTPFNISKHSKQAEQAEQFKYKNVVVNASRRVFTSGSAPQYSIVERNQEVMKVIYS